MCLLSSDKSEPCVLRSCAKASLAFHCRTKLQSNALVCLGPAPRSTFSAAQARARALDLERKALHKSALQPLRLQTALVQAPLPLLRHSQDVGPRAHREGELMALRQLDTETRERVMTGVLVAWRPGVGESAPLRVAMLVTAFRCQGRPNSTSKAQELAVQMHEIDHGCACFGGLIRVALECF